MKRERQKRKLLVSAILFIILVFGLPAAASAKTVAKIGGKSYSSIQKALNVVKNGQTIKLQCNVNMKKKNLTVNRNVSFTLDLNKKKLSNCTNFKINAGKVTIKNGTYVARKYSIPYTYGQISIAKGAKATLKTLKYTGHFRVAKGASFTINSGTYDKVYLFSDGTTTIKNGTFKNLGYIENGNKMTITKGNFDFIGSYDSGLYVENGGNLTIKGGNFKFPSYAWEPISNYKVIRIKRSVYNKLKRYISNYGGKVVLT